MKNKIVLCFLVMFAFLSITACGNNNVSEQGYDRQAAQETADNKQETQEPEEHGKDAQATDRSNETQETDNESKMTMEILLLKNDEIIETNKFSNNDKVSYVYDILNTLNYEATDDVSFSDGVFVYFYDESHNMIQSFHIYEGNYLKLNGLPDTYKITNTDFDCAIFFDELNKNILQ